MLQHLAPFMQAETIKKLTEEPNPNVIKKVSLKPHCVRRSGPMTPDLRNNDSGNWDKKWPPGKLCVFITP